MHTKPIHLPRATTAVRGFTRGTMSRTDPGREDFTTKASSKVFDEDHHYVHRDRKPFHDTRLHPEKHSRHDAKMRRDFTHDPMHESMSERRAHGRSSKKGAASKTHKGDKDYTSKRGDKDHHIGGHDVKKSKAPFAKKKKKKSTKKK